MNNDKYLLLDTALWAQADQLTVTPGLVRTKQAKTLCSAKNCLGRFATTTCTLKLSSTGRSIFYKCWYNPFIIDAATTDTPPAQRERGAYRAALVRAGGAGRQIRKHRGLVRTALVGREIQLIFELRDATLYSFSFSD